MYFYIWTLFLWLIWTSNLVIKVARLDKEFKNYSGFVAFHLLPFQHSYLGAEEVAQQLRADTALPKDGSPDSTFHNSQLPITLFPKDPAPSFDICRHYTHVHGHT